MSSGIDRTVLDGGLRVVSEGMADVRSVAVGFSADIGSRDEPDELAGASHFLEHLLFKGTATRTAREIAEAIESVGGEMNASTARESTVYYVRVPDVAFDLALDVLSDIVWAPAFRPEEVESERQVILEEIRMRDDSPEELVHDLFSEALLPWPLGREVIGTRESIESMTRDDIVAYHAAHYLGGTVVVAVAGNADHAHVVEGVAQRFTGRPGGSHPTIPAEGSPAGGVVVRRRPVEQAHLVLGVRSLPRDHPDRFALTVLNQALGGGMSSRLFQEIREERGLAYSTYSYRQGFRDTGLFGAYAATAPHQARDVLKLLHDAFDRLVDERGLSPDELERAKGAIKGHLALSLESPGARMNRIGRSELTLGEIPGVDELIARIDAVEADDVARVIATVLDGSERTIAAVGPFDAEDLDG